MLPLALTDLGRWRLQHPAGTVSPCAARANKTAMSASRGNSPRAKHAPWPRPGELRNICGKRSSRSGVMPDTARTKSSIGHALNHSDCDWSLLPALSVEIVKQSHDTKGFVVCRGAGWPSCCAWRLNIDGDRGNSERVPSLKLTQRQRGGSRKTTTAERPWIAAGPAPTPTTTRLSTRFIERMRCSSTPNRASAYAASATFKPLALLSRTESISQCGGCSAPPTSGPLN